MYKNWCPIVLNMYFQPGADINKESDKWIFSSEKQPVDEYTPIIKNVKIKNIDAQKCLATVAFIVGLPESPIENLKIKNFKYSMANKKELISTQMSETTGGVWHNDDRGIKIINTKNSNII
jgi:hypothetical protein